MPMAVKLARVGIKNEDLSSIKSQDSLITWSYKATWQIIYVVSPLPQ